MSATLVSLIAVTVAFTGLLVWVFRPSTRQRWEQAGRLPLDDEEGQP